MDQLLTVKQAAALLACSEAAVRKWIARRELAIVKVGRLTRLRRAELERFGGGSGSPAPVGGRRCQAGDGNAA